MRPLTAALVVVSALPIQISAQQDDRSLQRISLALRDPPPVLSRVDSREALRVSTRQALGVSTFEPMHGAPKLGPFTLGTPQLRGEIIRLSLPVGEYFSRAKRGLAAANRRRQETAARRRIEAELEAFAKPSAPQQERP